MKMRDTNTNVGGYPATLVYDYLKNTLCGQLPSDLQAAIKPTRVISGYGPNDSTNFTTTDNLYLLSGVEVFGADDYDTAAGTTTQLECYNNSSNSRIKQYNSTAPAWWLSPVNSNYSNTFHIVTNYGNFDGSYAIGIFGVFPAFRIA